MRYVNVATVIPKVTVGDCNENVKEIGKYVSELFDKGVDIAVFPELSVTGYTCGDLFGNGKFIHEAYTALVKLCDVSRSYPDITFVVGAPYDLNGILYNCAFVFSNGGVRGIVPKKYLPNYKEFYEMRWFAGAANAFGVYEDVYDEKLCPDNGIIPLGYGLLFRINNNITFGVEICEDLWAPIPPSSQMTLGGAELILNLSASDELIGKYDYLKQLVSQQSARSICAYAYTSSGIGESSTDMVFAGNSFIYENGRKLAETERLTMDSRYAISSVRLDLLENERRVNTTFRTSAQDPCDHWSFVDYEQEIKNEYIRTPEPALPFVPSNANGDLDRRCDEIIKLQSMGLARRLKAIHCEKAVIGVSGGLDSTLALLVCDKAYDMLGYDKKGIVAVTMPCFGTSERTHSNATKLMEAIGTTIMEVPIGEAVKLHFKDIGHDPENLDVTYENCQARERTQVLMDIANEVNGIVIGTGNLSELALGWCTYNADHMSMYNVNVSIPKTLVKWLVKHYGETTDNEGLSQVLADIVDTPISPELLPTDKDGNIRQKTEESVGPYELVDYFLYHFIRHGLSPREIYWMARESFSKEKYDDHELFGHLKTFFKRFFQQQFKRSCLADGPKIGSISLSPRGDWRMPSDLEGNPFKRDIERLEWQLESMNGNV